MADAGGRILPGLTGGGALVRAVAHADDVATVARVVDAFDESTLLYRSMRSGNDGLPLTGPTARTLGARPNEIPIDTHGMVQPATGGMSVSPHSPMSLPVHRRPPKMGGTGKDPVWCIRVCDLGPDLRYRPDPENPAHHGFIEPARAMSRADYQRALEDTRSQWKQVE